MSAVKPLDLLFFALETSNRPLHMAGFELFELPKRYRGDYISDLVQAFRSGEVGDPFDKVITGLDRGIPRWRREQPDLRHHVRHLAVPSPGRMDQLYELISFLNAPLIDRTRPLWECYVIEGVENNRFAILIKLHHALIDGSGGMKLFANSLNTHANSREFKRLWQPQEGRTRRSKRNSSFAQMIPGIQKAASRLLSSGRSLVKFRPQNMLMPFSAPPSVLNAPLSSSERRYAACDLPLAEVKRLGKRTGTTVNDVVMTAIDMGLRRYLDIYDAAPGAPLHVMMPMSLSDRGGAKGGNQVTVLLTKLGEPDLSPTERLSRVCDASRQIRDEASKIPPGALQLYTILLATGAVVTEAVPGFRQMPTNNLLISNMPGPQGKLYLAGAPLIGFYGLPIVPPGSGLNVTFLSCGESICLSVGANPDAVDTPFELTRYISESMHELAQAVDGEQKKRRSSAKPATKQRRKRN